MCAGHLMYFAGFGIADPEFDGSGSDVHEREAPSVGGPDWLARARARGKRDMNFGAIGDAHQSEVPGAGCDAVTARSVVLAVILWLHAHACKAQERCGHARNRWVV